ncbi:peptidoglycan D,D-transpeptidase FtsI family protein [Desulfoscipio geothermicus]|uniref:Peptidoglycan glycosyltransferase n=1 Tax=Desulfoscipio geothermicus DSM 3669 TaxID=1121426 RepID=A0A1I6DJB3_9FIRM|nr:penicillin-binding protein 2 [Desulfoscipio geothermicus]SFR05477.1 peptidoglycan glycosyltransferase [Desulfoscipio geothermicus DSM 3669]
MRNNVRRLAYILLVGLAAVCVYLALIPVYINHITKSGAALADPRIAAGENRIQRGAILDRHGAVLARSVPAENGYQREYPLGGAAAHIVGYYSNKYGAAGLEKSMARVLLGLEGGSKIINLRNRILGRPGVGNDITLTVDAGLQQYAAKLLAGKKGAVVVLDPATGEVLALASSPAFDPLQPAKYIDDAEAPLLNRALQGAYPPGSIFKIITAAAVLADLPGMAGDTIKCTGKLTVNGFTLHDNAVHGPVDFGEAFTKSCNVAFGRYGLALGAGEFLKQVTAFGIGKSIDFELPVYAGNITPAGEMDGPTLASSAIGQGEVLVTPLHAALLAGAVANDGVIMQPYLVAGYRGRGGSSSRRHPEEWRRAMTPAVAAALREQMINVVRQGTGRAAALPGVTVAGKTGSAENPHGKSHAWFVGFAPAEEPRVAVAVLLENAGSGGSAAAPLAREIIRKALQ